MYYYKFNLVQNNFIWYGSRACKKRFNRTAMVEKHKIKKYPLWNLNFLFSKRKYNNINFIKMEDGILLI